MASCTTSRASSSVITALEVVAGLPEGGDLRFEVRHGGAPVVGRTTGAGYDVSRAITVSRSVVAQAERDPGVVGTVGSVEVARRDEEAGGLGQAGGDLPAVLAPVGREPEVEGRRATGGDEAGIGEHRREPGPARGVAGALLVDVGVVAERGRGRAPAPAPGP